MDTTKSIRVIKVIECSLQGRGSGKDQTSPFRLIKQYYTLEGDLLAEVDPCAIIMYPESKNETKE